MYLNTCLKPGPAKAFLLLEKTTLQLQNHTESSKKIVIGLRSSSSSKCSLGVALNTRIFHWRIQVTESIHSSLFMKKLSSSAELLIVLFWSEMRNCSAFLWDTSKRKWPKILVPSEKYLRRLFYWWDFRSAVWKCIN